MFKVAVPCSDPEALKNAALEAWQPDRLPNWSLTHADLEGGVTRMPITYVVKGGTTSDVRRKVMKLAVRAGVTLDADPEVEVLVDAP